MPSAEADAEVFVTTARYLRPFTSESWLHVPMPASADAGAIAMLAGMPVIRAYAPARLAPLRHFCCGLTIVLRREFRQADLVYTRNLWVAWMAVSFAKRVVFDHYRPWPDQIPPLQFLLYRLVCHRKFLVNICHSEYTREKYSRLGIADAKLCCIRNGYEPAKLREPMAVDLAKQRIGVPVDTKTVVYTGRLNHRKGLELVIQAARRMSDILFILVGSQGPGHIETMSSDVGNIRIIPWQPPDSLGVYISAADLLMIPPSWAPLATFGSTVLPLKVFLYMASGRPIMAGDTADIREVLCHQRNAFLCRPDCVDSLAAGVRILLDDAELSGRLASTALADSGGFTWATRAQKIADIIAARLQSKDVPHGRWSRTQSRVWMLQSWRWLVHLVRTRSWVLPPDLPAVAPCQTVPAE